MKVGFCYNLKKTAVESGPGDLYAEWDDEETIEAVRSALARKNEVIPIEGDEDAFEKFKKHRPQVVFNIAEGMHGTSREAQIPAMLEMLRIPYTGSAPLTLALCLDKAMAKVVLQYHGIPTPPFRVAGDGRGKQGYPPLPLIVKPLREGSSKGITNSSLVRTQKQLRDEIHRVVSEYHQPALVEKFLPGREFTAALLGNGTECGGAAHRGDPVRGASRVDQPHLFIRGQMDLGHGGKAIGDLFLPGKNFRFPQEKDSRPLPGRILRPGRPGLVPD